MSEHWFDQLLSSSTKLTRRQAWGAVASILALAGTMDALSGAEAWFGPVYLLLICFCTWTLGWCAGVSSGIVCAAIGILVNGPAIYPSGEVAFVWNLLMRILAVAIMIVLIGTARRSYDREWLSARTDGLTGALNKAGFFEKVARERHGNQWGLLGYVDLDGLKRINDESGHAAGDDVLRAFTRGVHQGIRHTDAFARIGGDEFLIYQTVASEEEAHQLARQLHRRLNAFRSGVGHTIKCSMGALVTHPAHILTDADIDAADLLMYDAKRRGACLSIATRTASAPGAQAAEVQRPSSAGKKRLSAHASSV